MKRLTPCIHFRGLAGTALASLRVVGLMYTSLAGILALTLIVSVALLPSTEPGRQIVSGLVQPTTDAVSDFISAGPSFAGVAGPPQSAVAASPMSGVDVQAAIALTAGYTRLVDAAADNADRANYQVDAVDEPVALDAPVEAVAPVRVYRPVAARAAVVVEEPTAEVDEEDMADEAAPSPVVSEPSPAPTPVAVPAERAVLVVANQAPPKALPTLARPTETAQQVKDRQDVENQAAIDAGKAAQVRAKADADTANQRAINVQQATAVSLAQVRTQSDVANQTAIDASRGLVAPTRVALPSPTAQPTLAPAPTSTPAPTPVPAPVATEVPTGPAPVLEMLAPACDDAIAQSGTSDTGAPDAGDQ